VFITAYRSSGGTNLAVGDPPVDDVPQYASESRESSTRQQPTTTVPVVLAHYDTVKPASHPPADPVYNLPKQAPVSPPDRSQYSEVSCMVAMESLGTGRDATEQAASCLRTPEPAADPIYLHPRPPAVPVSDRSHYSEVLGGPPAVVGDPLTAAAAPGFSDLSVEDVAELLREIQLDSFVESFRRQGVDGELLANIDEQMLTGDEFAMSRFQARKLMLSVTHGWRPKLSDR